MALSQAPAKRVCCGGSVAVVVIARHVSGVRLEVGGLIGGEISPVCSVCWPGARLGFRVVESLIVARRTRWRRGAYLEDHPSDCPCGLGDVHCSVVVWVCDQGQDLGGQPDGVAEVIFRLRGLARGFLDGRAVRLADLLTDRRALLTRSGSNARHLTCS